MAQSTRIEAEEDDSFELRLKLWICTDHDRAPAGKAKVASYVLAYTEEQAEILLDRALIQAQLRPKRMWRYRLEEVPFDRPKAEVLNDGDY